MEVCGDKDLTSRLQVLLSSLGTSVKQFQPGPMDLGFGSSSGAEAAGLAGRLFLDESQVTFSFLVACQCWHCGPHLQGDGVCGPVLLYLLPLSFHELLAVASVSFLSVSEGPGEPIGGVLCLGVEGPIKPFSHSPLTLQPQTG